MFHATFYKTDKSFILLVILLRICIKTYFLFFITLEVDVSAILEKEVQTIFFVLLHCPKH